MLTYRTFSLSSALGETIAANRLTTLAENRKTSAAAPVLSEVATFVMPIAQPASPTPLKASKTEGPVGSPVAAPAAAEPIPQMPDAAEETVARPHAQGDGKEEEEEEEDYLSMNNAARIAVVLAVMGAIYLDNTLGMQAVLAALFISIVKRIDTLHERSTDHAREVREMNRIKKQKE